MKILMNGTGFCLLSCLFVINPTTLICFFSSVPIIPEYLYQLDHPEHAAGNFNRISETTRPITTTASVIWATDATVATTGDGDEESDEQQAVTLLTTLLPSSTPVLATRKPSRRRTTGTRRPVTNATTLSPEDAELRHEELVEVNVRVGLMFASKAGMQLLANPFVGHLTNKFGYSIPMFTGFCVMFVSTISKCGCQIFAVPLDKINSVVRCSYLASNFGCKIK